MLPFQDVNDFVLVHHERMPVRQDRCQGSGIGPARVSTHVDHQPPARLAVADDAGPADDDAAWWPDRAAGPSRMRAAGHVDPDVRVGVAARIVGDAGPGLDLGEIGAEPADINLDLLPAGARLVGARPGCTGRKSSGIAGGWSSADGRPRRLRSPDAPVMFTIHFARRSTSTIVRLRWAPSKYQKSGPRTLLSDVQHPSPSFFQICTIEQSGRRRRRATGRGRSR